ncbi:hypothetical protein V6N13_039102 [Hibiscus sabdariffa]|uniref:Uncharacterized protein n=1 Tax=Hibiscus sabdariffa TaxID=183260 RepID=A0ABR2SWH6_9ROSI
MRGLISITNHQKGGAIVCPEPRRVGLLAYCCRTKPLALHTSHCAEVSGSEILDIILNREDLETDHEQYVVSPPSRAANPLVRDAWFGDERLALALSTLQTLSPSLLVSSLARKAGCVGMKFGLKPAAVRVEGFDCHSRDDHNSGIPAMA